MNRKTTIIIACLLSMSASCGFYRTTSRSAGDIKRIAVPYLKNDTPEPDVEIVITQAIIDGIVRDNTLKVVSEDDSDGILEASITEYRNLPYTFAQTGADVQAEQYRLTVSIRASLFDRGKNTYIWENRVIKATGDYYLETTSEQTYEKALEDVYRDLVEAILSATVQDW
ncbi:MAG: LPS assembly lipoprotein LptE [Candidatus Krumholzibacteria bacterium]|nr:LPS assembly lipoprotein LptE [Candidatus Krumholzibacteria bacterium]